ncbi:DUF5309 family protein [Parabacteroides sp. AM08-6]|uniref:SU10 major capsid protein n=1 Tax=Parabacteroides sp. AM08-6 TaxID=2292053 RepID=UPI000FF4749A|nr:DUF5309 family protein [Parabacteroides sp. AM08-6]RHJ77698.1 hypothetical protein DW103_16010 [Parabacteroides sp. AM08-6]
MKDLFKNGSFVMMLIMILCSFLGVVDAGAIGAEAVTGPTGGVVETNQVVTTQFTHENSEDLLLNDIERRVVKIRPMGNPLEQLSRYATRRKSNSQKHQYYSTDTLPVSAKVKTKFDESTGLAQATIDTTNNGIFSKYETIIVPSVNGYTEAGVKSEEFLVLYILDKAEDGKLIVEAVNGKKIGDNENSIPSLPADTILIRAGRAHNEIDMQTTTYACVPTKKTQYLQIFRAQIEESTLQKISDKEADWTFSDLEEEAIFDMKRGMNKSFWLGARKIIYDKSNKEVYLTGGIWWQAGKTFAYGTSSSDLQFTESMLVDLMKKAFTGNAGNKTKIFIMGSDLMANLSKIKRDRIVNDDKVVTKYGVKFKEIETNFGTLWCVHDESLDEMGFADKGLIFDANYLRKISVYELKTKDLDLRKAGTKDVDARTISEISGLVLQNPDAHVKVVPIAA